jgi:hypothetical protein
MNELNNFLNTNPNIWKFIIKSEETTPKFQISRLHELMMAFLKIDDEIKKI